jgi:hypothetical protein
MESEKKDTAQKTKEIRIGFGMTYMQDLGTNNQDLRIRIMNSGPAREIEYYITDQMSQPTRIRKLQNGGEATMRLGDLGKGQFLMLTNKDVEDAYVLLNW